MAAVAICSRKRAASPFLDVAPRVAKHGRFSPSCAGQAAAAARWTPFDPLDALRRVFPDADPSQIEACFVASGRNIHATVEAFRTRQAKEAAATRLTRAAARADMDECASVLVEHMSAAADLADAKNRASWILALVKDAVAEREAAAQASSLKEENAALRAQASSLKEENAALRAQASSLKEEIGGLSALAASSAAEAMKLREENAALKAQAAATERDNAVLKRGVFLLNARQEEAERAAEEMKKKVAELEMANYALGIRLRDADSCRFQAFRGRDAF